MSAVRRSLRRNRIAKLKKFDDLDEGSDLVVVVDPSDSSQTITPQPNQLLTIEADATRRTFLFDRFNGKTNPCAVCDVAQAGSEYKKRVCDHMMCVVNGVRGIEFVQSNGKWTPLSPLRRREDDAPALAEPSGRLHARLENADSRPRFDASERRVQWESALRSLEERARAELILADEHKRKAKRCEKTAKLLRVKVFELVQGGSEKFESATPLFDFLPREDEDNE